MRWTRRALVAATIVLAASAPASAQQLELLRPGELSAATEGTFPPFSMTDPRGQLEGLEIRVMREVAKRLNLSYKPVVLKWESMLVGLQVSRCT